MVAHQIACVTNLLHYLQDLQVSCAMSIVAQAADSDMPNRAVAVGQPWNGIIGAKPKPHQP